MKHTLLISAVTQSELRRLNQLKDKEILTLIPTKSGSGKMYLYAIGLNSKKIYNAMVKHFDRRVIVPTKAS